MLAPPRSSFAGLSFSQCIDDMGRGRAEDGGGEEKKARSNGGKKKGGCVEDDSVGWEKFPRLMISYTILLGYPGVIPMCFVFKD